MGLFDKLFGSDDDFKPSEKENTNDIDKIINNIKYTGSERIELKTFNHSFIIDISKDEFDDDVKVKFFTCGDYLSDKVMTFSDEDAVWLYIGFKYENNTDYLALGCYQKNIKFNVGEKIGFIFYNGNKSFFEITEKGYRVDRDDEGIIIETKIPINKDVIDNFMSSLKKWRYETKDNRKITGTLDNKTATLLAETAEAYQKVKDDIISKF